MQLRHRLLKGLTRSSREVEQTLTNLGFERIEREWLEYQLLLTDAVTRLSYSLRIPCYPVKSGSQEHIRLGIPYLTKRNENHPPGDGEEKIPLSIRNAAREKAVEVYTYLKSLRVQ